MRMTRRALAATLLAFSCGVVPALAVTPLIPHRAVYDLTLDQASDRSGITGLKGRMVYEFNGSPCDGYTVTFRSVTEIQSAEASRLSDQQTTTFEEADGKSFSFVTKSFIDSSLDREVRGTAQVEPDKLEVELEKPETAKLDLGRTQFPTQHLREMIQRATTGETFYETNLFDGSDGGDKVMTTTVIVGKKADAKAGDPELPVLSALGKDKFWPVDIAYFDESGEGGEEMPEYRVSFKLHENGVTRDLVMDYGDFSMTGKLVNLSLLPASQDCKP